ncbi:hypothetical protein EDC65_0525 [Stella humosa]|uniref:DUF3147 family protein n=1 Tax=Stella humosa TaxID=94 RepID=A0A3N1MF54_9PROT|nr:hypothetical protein [Stella humosa]ROQ01347.1 hypothetical protein EDC65_0525 [Stella humosa]BBK31721.1 hypothetical protein STHU_23550 [Stella humosa]
MLLELGMLLVKMILTAAVVVGASVVAERSGPLLGGVIISLPISSGPGMFFLALQAEDRFIADSVLYTLGMSAAIAVFLIVYPRLAVHFGAFVSVGGALLVWCGVGVLVQYLPLQLWSALGLTLAAFGAAILVPRPAGLKPPPRPVGISGLELVGRALITGGIIAGVVTVSALIGPRATGILMSFPTAFTAIAFIMHRRHGGGAAAATLLASTVGMLSFVAYLIALYLLIMPLGALPALGVALCVAATASTIIAVTGRRRARNRRLQPTLADEAR